MANRSSIYGKYVLSITLAVLIASTMLICSQGGPYVRVGMTEDQVNAIAGDPLGGFGSRGRYMNVVYEDWHVTFDVRGGQMIATSVERRVNR